jgi:ribosomal protein S18 acetylase RimI-like enzyme
MMEMKIVKSDINDLDLIMKLLELGTNYQKTVAERHWLGFDRNLIAGEIHENNQWKVLIGQHVAGIFTTSFSDPLIWTERNSDAAIYLHRIVTDPAFRGQGLVKHVLAWAKHYAAQNGKRYIRMDTGSGNEKLNNYYISCGFSYLGVTELDNVEGLPDHYKRRTFSLFEVDTEKKPL